MTFFQYIYDIENKTDFSKDDYTEMLNILSLGIFKYVNNCEIKGISIDGTAKYNVPNFLKEKFCETLLNIFNFNDEELLKLKNLKDKIKYIDKELMSDNNEIYLSFDEDDNINTLLILKDIKNNDLVKMDTMIKYFKTVSNDENIMRHLINFIIYSRNIRKQKYSAIILQIEKDNQNFDTLKPLFNQLVKKGFRINKFKSKEDKNV